MAQAAAGPAGFFSALVVGNAGDVSPTHFGNLDVIERLQIIVLAERPSVDGADFFDGGETLADGKHILFTVLEVFGEEGGGVGVEPNRLPPIKLGPHRIEIHEPALEQRPRHRL